MDPLSVISGVAGIATAGTALVSSLYTLVQTVRKAPREMQDVAREMQTLTGVLEFLHEIISDGYTIATHQYLSGIQMVVKSIQNTQNEIMDMIEDPSVLRRLKWRNAKTLLQDIRAHQNMVSMQVAILNLGMLAKSNGQKEKASKRRLRKQAESLVQASSVCLEASKEPIPLFVPPPPRSASPPFDNATQFREYDTYKQTRSGHGFAPNLSVHPERTRQENDELPREESPVDASHPPIILPSHNTLPVPPNTSQPAQSGSAAAEAARKHTLMTYKHNNPGDAATLLYNLVFSSGEDSGYESDQASVATSDTNGAEDSWSVEDYSSCDEDVNNTIRRENRMARRRANRGRSNVRGDDEAASTHSFIRKSQNNASQDQPAIVVNRLLLKWTSLTNQEVEQSAAGTEEYTENDRLKSIRGTVAEIAAGNQKSENNARIPDPDSSLYESDSMETNPPASSNHWRRPRRPSRQDSMPRAYTSPYNPYGQYPYGYPPPPRPAGPFPSTQNHNSFSHQPPPHPGTMPYYSDPRFGTYREPFAPYAGQRWDKGRQNPDYFTPQPTEGAGFFSFKAPNILILPSKFEIDEGKGFGMEQLDVSNKGFRIERQRPGEDIWDSKSFISENGLHGEGILGALAASKSNSSYSELWKTLEKGFDYEIVYSRCSDLGETWFLGDTPAFALFYHSSYEPQFFPVLEDDKMAFDRSFVTVSEQWITEEALKQHGIVPRGKEKGKYILDPSISSGELNGLIQLSQDLVWLEQRRRYGKTFYKPLETFREVHGLTTVTSTATTSNQQGQQQDATNGSTESRKNDQMQSPKESQVPGIKSGESNKVEEATGPGQSQPQPQAATLIAKTDQPSSEPVVLDMPRNTDRESKTSPKGSRRSHVEEETGRSHSEQRRSERRRRERRRLGRESSESVHPAKEQPDEKRSHWDHGSSHHSSSTYIASEDKPGDGGHRRKRSGGRKSRQDEPHQNKGSDSGISGVFSFLRRT